MPLIAYSRDPVDLPPDAFDVRDWEVRTEPDDVAVGRVEDMLLEPDGRPRFVVATLRSGDMGHLLVPLSAAWADASRNVVWVRGLTEEELRAMPRYEGDPGAVSAEVERRLVEEYRSGGPARTRAPENQPRLVRMGELEEHRVAKNSTDPRGWTVVGGDGGEVGEVVELLVDRAERRARYLDVDVDEKRLGVERLDRHILLPLERVRLDGDEKHVVVDGLFARDVARYPVYTGLPLADEASRELDAWYRETAGPAEGDAWTRSERDFFGRPGTAPPAGGGPARVSLPGDGEVRIRVSGSDVIIERSERGDDRG